MEKFQEKSITPVDVYKFTLSKELERQAKNELRETEDVRNHAIEALREWVMKNPRIEKTRLDSNFLLRFLRFKKFSIPMAMEAMERYLVIKDGNFGRKWAHNMDITRPSMMKLIDDGFVVFLPAKDDLGRTVAFYRFGVADPMAINIGFDVMALMAMVMDLLMQDEENQIRGVVHVVDAKGMGMPHFTVFSPQYSFRIGKNSEKTLALRHKGFHVVNTHRSLSIVHDIIFSHLSQKLKERAHLYRTFDEFNAIDKKMLPEEYGGTVPLKAMIDSIREKIVSRRDFYLSYDEMKVCVDMYPKEVTDGSVKALKHSLNSSDLKDKFKSKDIYGISGMQGSFRKLEID